jgi:hypothetical protein
MLIGGCRRRDQSLALVHTVTPDAPETDPQNVEVRPLSQLLPDQPTHLAADSFGNIYWVQETSSGQDILFVAGSDDIPQPTALTSDAIIAAFGPAPAPISRPGSAGAAPGAGSGNIQSIVIDADDNVLFFFSGGIGRSMRVCLGRFNPHDQSIHILAGTQSLAMTTHMGSSIGIAQGQLIKPLTQDQNQSMRYWLWLHHSDAAVFLRFNPRSAGPGQPIEFSRAFDRLSGDGAPESLSADLLEFSAGADNSLLMIDWHEARLWRVDENGLATKWMTLLGLPRYLSNLTARPGGIAIAFAPTGEKAFGTEEEGQVMLGTHTPQVKYPALLGFDGDQVVPIASLDDMQGPPLLDVAKLQLREMIPTNVKRQWAGYDAASGLLVRLQLSAKN